MRKSNILKGIIVICVAVISVMLINFFSYVAKAKKQLAQMDDKVQTVQTSYGTMSYIDEGAGEVLLVAHGLFGGYDQGYNSLKEISGQYRILAPSRFGYVGTDLPERATVSDQAKAYKELLDELNIDKVYVLGTSAGGTAALIFALQYPDSVKGIILYCSNAVPTEKPSEDEIEKYLGAPKIVCNDFMMWLAGPVMKKVMNMTDETWLTVFPVRERAKGAINDGYEANLDAHKNYNHYTLEKIEIPVLVMHAKDDQMASYQKIEDMVHRFSKVTFISFEEGGHMMTGNEEQVKKALVSFIEKLKRDILETQGLDSIKESKLNEHIVLDCTIGENEVRGIHNRALVVKEESGYYVLTFLGSEESCSDYGSEVMKVFESFKIDSSPENKRGENIVSGSDADFWIHSK